MLALAMHEAGGGRLMPVIFRYRGFRFFFYSNEGCPREPAHVHVEKGEHEAKFWIEPVVAVAYNDGFSAKVLRDLLDLVTKNQGRIKRAWHDYFG
jgi:hypothetical protein